MEPLRGGRLADKLPPKSGRCFTPRTPPFASEWAFRWVYTFPGGNHGAVRDEFDGHDRGKHPRRSDALPDSFTEGELRSLKTLRKMLLELQLIPCTGCNYCMPAPRGGHPHPASPASIAEPPPEGLAPSWTT
jgi:predicted aldo/keto reductase-like oxidoreductase